uniref:Putative RxLR effector n=1 Tax=Plasmopara viticola TaxID=143451 RepID=A0A650F646_PLAVT|nr:putative RxLR effector [Plasmopara viticola]
MTFPFVLKRVAWSGILLSLTLQTNGISVALEENATSAVSKMQHDRGLKQPHATLAPVDDDDDDEEARALAAFESVGKAAKKAMKSLKTNEMAKKVLHLGKTKDKKLAKTMALFDKHKVPDNDPDLFFKQVNFYDWSLDTLRLYHHNEEKAYAAMFSTLLARKKGDEEAVARLIGNPSYHYSEYLMEAQVNHWKASNFDTKKVYDLLKLRVEGSNLLDSPKLHTWINYAKANEEVPSEKLWELLTSNKVWKENGKPTDPSKVYNIAELGMVVHGPRTTANANRLGPFLEKMLLAKWKHENYPIADALRDVGVGTSEVAVWLAYTRSMKDPYKIFKTGGKLDPEEVARAISSALQSRNSNLVATGNRMQQPQIKPKDDS